MINKILKIVLGKELILYNPHRNSEPLVNKVNREDYIFFNPGLIWKATALVGRKTRFRSKLIYWFLSLMNPVYIIDINWLERLQTLYFVWCKKHDGSSFIVIQHGNYYGGVMRDIPEKYIKCNIMLVWGDFYKGMFEENNRGKYFQCITFGNPCYNDYNRSQFSYKESVGNRILVAVSVIKGKRLKALYKLLEKLEDFGFDITIKEHNMHNMQDTQSEPITGYKKILRSQYLYPILKRQEYDIVITDLSSAMTDIIFFKNRAIYFSPPTYLNDNIYSLFLDNLGENLEAANSGKEILSYIDIDAQERLLQYLIKTKNTSNDLSQITEFSSTKVPLERKIVAGGIK